MTEYLTKTAASIAVAVMLALTLGLYLSFNYPVEATRATQAGATFSIHVINSSTMLPIADISVFAGPTTSPSDVIMTPAGPTLAECVHGVPTGSAVEANGSVLFPDGTLVTFPPCLLKQYVTDGSGWVYIRNASSEYYFVRAGNIIQQNAAIIGFKGTNAFSVTVPWPSGNITLGQPNPSPNCVVSYQSAFPSGVELLYERC